MPPSVTGMMWLTSLPLSPQRWQVCSSRLRMMFLIRFHSAVLVLPSPHAIALHLFPLFLLVDVLLYRRKDSNLLSQWRQGYSLPHLSVDAATVCPLIFIVSGVETSRRASQQCALLIPCLPREVEDQVEMDGFEPSIPRRVRRLHLPRFIPRKPNHHSHAVRELGVSLSLYQVTVLRVLHGICTHVAWLVET